MKFYVLAIAFLYLNLQHGKADEFPAVTLKAKDTSVRLYLPDAAKGFYRGSRFDWSGVLSDLQYQNFTLFSPWKAQHNPLNHDDITGPSEEFGMNLPIRYAEAKPGETFVKLGIGELLKPDDKPYTFFTNYKVVNSGEWKCQPKLQTQDTASFELTQIFRTLLGFSYEYTKHITLTQSKLTLDHTLKNTGSKEIHTDYYNHHFFNVNQVPIGPAYRFVFDSKIAAGADAKFGSSIQILDKQLRFTRPLKQGESIFGTLIDTKTNKAATFPFTLQFQEQKNKPTLQIRATGDTNMTKFQLWGIGTTICPEPFQELRIAPGKTIQWSIRYQLQVQ